MAIFWASCVQILFFKNLLHHTIDTFYNMNIDFFSWFWCIIQLFSIFRGQAKMLPIITAVLRALSLPAGSWWTRSELALGPFSEQSPVGNGASHCLQSSGSPGYKWAIWCHQSQLSLSARRVQNIPYPCCSSLYVCTKLPWSWGF